jgi:hypothetical protein
MMQQKASVQRRSAMGPSRHCTESWTSPFDYLVIQIITYLQINKSSHHISKTNTIYARIMQYHTISSSIIDLALAELSLWLFAFLISFQLVLKTEKL